MTLGKAVDSGHIIARSVTVALGEISRVAIRHLVNRRREGEIAESQGVSDPVQSGVYVVHKRRAELIGPHATHTADIQSSPEHIEAHEGAVKVYVAAFILTQTGCVRAV